MSLAIHSPNDVDLDCHAVIEASAGTGKTYNIENLVTRLVAEGRARLEEILVVTFTDKATGELKERIRANLADACQHEQETDRQRTQDALDLFDTAQIFTIHGFCQRVLMQYAFENNLLFEPQIQHDAALYDRLFDEQLRTRWMSEHLPKLSLEDQRAAHKARFYRFPIVDIASKQRPGDIILPERRAHVQRRQGLESGLRKLLQLVSPIGDDVKQSAFYRAYCGLDFSATEHTDGAERIQGLQLSSLTDSIILPLLRLLRQFQDRGRLDEALLTRIDNWYSGIRHRRFAEEGHFDVLIPPRYRDVAQVDSCPQLKPLVTTLRAMDSDLSMARDLADNQVLGIAVDCIADLQQAAREYKSKRGLVSFDDLLRLVDHALDPKENPNARLLTRTLQSRYRYVFVDEFQDTDRVQWSIFSRLFVSDAHRLFLIGDPKQAIYSFRGADVHTYLDAKALLTQQQGAQQYYLPTNWRSTPAMLDVFNRLFGAGWFPDEKIPYLPVQAPDTQRSEVVADATGRPALTVLDLTRRQMRAFQAQRRLGDFIAAEIDRLLNDPAVTFEFTVDDRPRRLQANDICILVRRAREAEAVENALNERGISHSYYRKQGLFQSVEATQLHQLFRAIAHPNDREATKKALLTRFFRFTLEETEQLTDPATEHTARQLLLRWHEYSIQRSWSVLFQSLLVDSGLKQEEARSQGGERRFTNYQHILQELQVEATRRNLDFVDLIELLANYRARHIELEMGGDVHRPETARPTVQIMTIHACKGLEFPVVFVAGGFGGRRYESYWKYHNDDGRVVFDLAKNKMNEKRQQEEQRNEERRLYYVALTRAMYKLYLPMYENRYDHGPLSTFIYDCLQTAWPQQQNAEHVQYVDTWATTAAAAPQAAEVHEATPSITTAGHAWCEPDFLFAREKLCFNERRVDVTSFSALQHTGHGQPAAATEFDDITGRDNDEWSRLAAAETAEAPQAELPKGNRVGSMLHDLLELLNWADAANGRHEQLLEGKSAVLIDDLLLAYRIADLAPSVSPEFLRQETARLLVNCLSTPLLPDGTPLHQTAASDRLHELEFHYPTAGTPDAARQEVLSQQWSHGFITGFIDLVLRHNGMYYIIDWKSNHLDHGYGPHELGMSMDDAQYHLQYQLYTIALRRWLRQRQPEHDFHPQFGGIFYLYLRGMNGLDQSSGVFHYRPKDNSEIDGWEAAIEKQIDRHG